MSKKINRWWQQWMIATDEWRTRASESFHVSPSSGRRKLALQLNQLEPRLLFSATPLDVAAMAGAEEMGVGDAGQVTAEFVATESETDSIETLADQNTTDQTATEIVFIDSAVPNLQQLLDDLNQPGRNLEAFVLDADRDGIDQITEVLGSRSDLSSIHIVSHAENGSVKLGNLWLGDSNLDAYAGQLAAWQSSLTTDADILLYGCDLAQTQSGQTFLDSISALTGADVSASDDDTGHATFDANWELEYATGLIETEIVFSDQLQDNWIGKLATITVTTTLDVVDGDTSSISNLQNTQGADGFISLREAILAVNEGSGGDTILLGSGTYTLSIAGNDNNARAGDLDINGSVTIIGVDARSTIIDGGGIDRVFHLRHNSTVASLSNLTVQGGSAEDKGGGIFVDNQSTLNLTDVSVLNNNGNNGPNPGFGGAIYVDGTLNANRVTIADNSAASGAGIYFNKAEGGTLTNVTISGNTSTSQGGGIYTDDTDITINNSTITANQATDGGGIHTFGGTVTLSNTIVADNNAGSASVDVLGSFSSDGSNLIGVLNGTSGFGNDITGVSAGLAILADNGGQTDSHALLTGSRAIHAGTSSGVGATDQRGEARNGPVDIGAFELQIGYQESLWLSTGSNVSNSGTTGLQDWTNGEAITLGDPNLNLGSGTSEGTLSSAFNLDDFVDGTANINGLHYVSRNVTVGGSNAVDLQVGDVLFTTLDDEQISAGGLEFAQTDIVLFRPTELGDYSSGTFSILMDQIDDAGLDQLMAFTLVEQDTTVGDVTLQAGDFLYTSGRYFATNDVYWYQTTDAGNGTTSGTRTKLLEGNDLGLETFSSIISGVELIETDITIGGKALTSGMLLLQATGNNDTVGNAESISTTDKDVFVLEVLETIPGGGDTNANTSILLRGNDIGFNTSDERINAIALGPNAFVNTAPTEISPGSITVNENTDATSGYSLATLNTTDVDASETFTYSIVGGSDQLKFSIGGASDDELILTDGILDFENKTAYDVIVQVTDSASNTYNQTISVSVIDLNDNAPVITPSQSFTVNEAAENMTILGTVSATDIDTVGGPSDWAIVSGNDDNIFTIDESTGVLSIDDNSNLDFESTTSYTLLLSLNDGSNPVSTETIAIAIADDNDDAPAGLSDHYVIDEDTTLDSNDAWFDADWGFRRTITFENTNRTNDLNGFPVLIKLDASRIDYAQTRNNGQDLRFVDGDGTVLAHEIESWDESGTSYVWVNIPTIDQGSNSDFVWMYYGNSSASNGQDRHGVWATSNEAVYHFDNSAFDSTSNNNGGTLAGATYVEGQFGDALGFGANSGVVTVDSSASIDDIFANGGTVSAWFNASDWGETGFGRIIQKSSGMNPSPNGWSLQVNQANQTIVFDHGFSGDFGEWRLQSNSVTLGQWHQVTVVYDASSAGNDPIIYLDGVALTVIEERTPTGTGLSDAGLDLLIGNHTPRNRTFDGVIDEVRLSSNALSTEQVTALYQSGTDNLVTFGYQQSAAGVIGNDTDRNGDVLTATLVGSDPANAAAFNFNSDGTFTYTPDANFNGTDTFTYRISDGSNDSDLIGVTITVSAVNDAPTLGSATLAAIDEDTSNPAGETIANLFGGEFTDVDDSSSMLGIIVVENDATASDGGVWQYTSDNTQWFDIGSVDDAGNGLLISTASKIRFAPVANYHGTPTQLVVRGVDNTFSGNFSSTAGGQTRQVADTSTPTPTAFFSNNTSTLETSVTSVNDLPTIGGTNDSSIDDTATSQPFASVTIADIEGDNVTVLISVSDGDNGGVFTAASLTASGFNKDGQGEYSLSARSTSDAQTAIRQLVFAPTENQVTPGNTVVNNFTIAVADASPAVVNGDTDITVTSVNDAPALSNGSLAPIAEDDTNPAGATVATLFASSFSDTDTSASLSGIVVVQNSANATTQGVWQHSSNSADWFNIGSVDDSGSGLAIAAGSSIRFLPVTDFNGTPTSLVVRGLDDTFTGAFSSTTGTENRQLVDTSTPTPTAFFSNNTSTLETSVTPVNDLPTIGGTNDSSIDDTATSQPFASVTIADIEGDDVTVLISVSDGDNGGVFTAASLTASGFNKDGQGEYSLSARSTSDAQTAIRQLVFAPTENQVTPGNTVVNNFTIAVADASPAVVNGDTDITVTSVNDAPALSNGSLAPIAEDDTNPPGATVATLFASSFSDTDASASLSGIVVVQNSANGTTQGVWQHSSNSADWFNIGSVDDSGSGLAIAAGSSIRFLPVTDFNGTPTSLVVRGLDDTFTGAFSSTAGTENRQLVNTSSPTATSAFSNATATLTTSVTANIAPVIGGAISNQDINDDQTTAPFSTLTLADNENDSITVVVTLSGGDSNGQFTTSSLSNTGFTKTNVGEYSLALSTTGDAQTAIRGLIFAPTTNQVAVGSTVTSTFQVTVNDGRTTTDSGTTVIANSVNDAPTDITLSDTTIDENVVGAVIGTIGLTDPDTGDSHTWAVDDGRFDVDGTNLILRAGQSLDHELEPNVSITVTARDQLGTGLAYSETFTIITGDQNESPTDITLDNTTVQGAEFGANVGQVAAIDPDNGDVHDWQISDSRFTVIDGVLKLKSNQVINASSEPTINLVITVTDAAGLTHDKSFTIEAIPPEIPLQIVPVGDSGSPSPAETPNNDEAAEDQEATETESNERANEEEATDSSIDETAIAKAKIGMDPGTINERISAANIAASAIAINGIELRGDAESNASANSSIENTFSNFRSASGTSSSIASNITADRVSSGLIRYGLGSTSLATSQANLAMMAKPGEMWNQFDQRLQGLESQIKGDLIIVGAAGAATSSFMVGVAAWGLRTGFLASGLISQLPAWRAVDPLLIMQGSGDGDDESLEDLIKRRSDELDDLEVTEDSIDAM